MEFSNNPSAFPQDDGLSKELEISISGRDLPDTEVYSAPHSVVIAYVQPFGSREWVEYDRTEMIKHDKNPNFTKKINILYRFEELQLLKFKVYASSSSTTLKVDEHADERVLVGWVDVTLGSLASQRTIRKRMECYNYTYDLSSLVLTAEELASNKEEVELRIVAHKLDNKDFWGKSDPYFIIYKYTEMSVDDSYIAVYKSERIRYTLNPVWKRFKIPLRTLNNGDNNRKLKLECWDWNSSCSAKFIGETYFTLQQLLNGPLPMSFPCINAKKQKKKSNYTDSGRVEVKSCKIHPVYTFLDYLIGGTVINCTIAIDFTASNISSSLHNYSTGSTQYELALSAVGEIIEDYDTDKQIPVLGFGARVPPDWRVSHEFHVNLNEDNPYCYRIPEVIAAYRHCLTKVVLSGPTLFAPVIRHVTNFAREHTGGTHYFILLILTDGVINDMYDTKDAIVDAAELPVSIIIVGIGNADFSEMDELDSDSHDLVGSKGTKAKRDIVQFIPFKKFLNLGLSPDVAKLHLAREVLQEVPDQLLGYMKSRNIEPGLPRTGDINCLPPESAKL